jgi:hypothetical protein
MYACIVFADEHSLLLSDARAQISLYDRRRNNIDIPRHHRLPAVVAL